MRTYSNAGGKTFAPKVAMMGLDIKKQVETLNYLYRGNVEFGRGCYRTIDDDPGVKEAICIRWVAEDIDDLELPECRYIAAQKLFSDDYEGNVRTLRLPKCLKKVRLSEIDEKAGVVENLVIQPNTEYINDEGILTIVKENEDGSQSEMKLCLHRHYMIIDTYNGEGDRI